MKVTVVCDKCFTTNTYDNDIKELGQNSSFNIQKHIKLFTCKDTRIFDERCRDCGNPFHITITCQVTQQAGNSMNAIKIDNKVS